MTNFVQLYKSTDLNAPPLAGLLNSLIKGPLNCCLVDGYGWTATAVSITRVGTLATVTLAAADMLRVQTGNILTMSGATGADGTLYNITVSVTWLSTTTFTYTMAGTPTGSAAGTVTVSSFLPITSIARSGTTALVTMNNANSGLVNGNYLAMSGAAQSDYNITAQIKVPITWVASTAYVVGALAINDTGKIFVCRTAGTSASSGGPTGTGTAITDGTVSWDFTAGTSTTVFSYQVANSPTTPATGTIVYMKAPLAWTRPFAAGTNTQSYRSADATSNRLYLQVIDTGATAGGAAEAQVYGAEILTADSTPNNGGGAGSGQFPTITQAANSLNWKKSATVDSVQRAWAIIGDDRTFYLQMSHGGGASSTSVVFFGHFISYKAGDGYNTIITGGPSFGVSNPALWNSSLTTSSANSCYVPRSYTQTGTSLNEALPAFGTGTLGNSSTLAWPNGPDSGLYVTPIGVFDTVTVALRGRLPGIYAPLHSMQSNGWANYDQATGVTGLSGVTLTGLVAQSSGSNYYGMWDTFGPWT